MVLRYHRRHGAKAAINVKYSEACKTLEIEEQTAPKAAKAAYRRLVQQHHPDKGGDAEKFMAVVRAYKGYLARYPFAHATQRHQAAAQKRQAKKTTRSAFSEAERANWAKRVMPDDKTVEEVDTGKDNLIGFLITALLAWLTWLAWGDKALILTLIGAIAVFLFLGWLSKKMGYLVWVTWRFIIYIFSGLGMCLFIYFCFFSG